MKEKITGAKTDGVENLTSSKVNQPEQVKVGWFQRNKQPVIVTTIVGLLVAGTVGIFASNVIPGFGIMIAPPIPLLSRAPLPTVKPVLYFSPLTGNLVANKAATTLPVTGIMIENSEYARPQSGLKDAGVVFEALAEGGITRFLALYQETKPQLIGPVRSVRLHFVEWAAAFNASIAHVGGSDPALDEVRDGNYRDIDEFFNEDSYWRATDRESPHDVYTSFKKLGALNAAKGYTQSNFTGFTRTDSRVATKPTATIISVTMGSDSFNSAYVYDPATNFYNRSEGGKPHLDREDGQITPRVVIVLKTNIYSSGVLESVTTVGSGTATIFQNGLAQEVTWNKLAKTSQIKFTDAAGQDVPLSRGQTWITVVPAESGGVTWN